MVSNVEGVAAMGRIAQRILSLLLVGMFAGHCMADVRLPHLVSDNMVLQRDMQVPIWGWADPGEKVTVALAGKTADVAADADSRWMVKIGPFAAGGPHEMQVRGKNEITVKNVLVGEVWLCSGQSNLIFRVGQNTDAQEVAAKADTPRIRMLVVGRDVASKPLDDVEPARWVECSPRTVGGFSAVGYFFGRDIHAALDVPVGLIQSGVTDTRVEFYMSREALRADPAFAFVYERWARWKKMHTLDETFPDIEENLHEVYQDQRPMRVRWQKAAAEAKQAGREPPPEPKYVPWRIFKNYPSGQYNAIIHPLIPYGIRGVVWYQGEGNITTAALYAKLLPVMIRSWRAEWGQGDFPFLFVQLPWNHPYVDWAELREAQTMTLRAVPNTGMAVTHDIEIVGDIGHPPQKEPFGQRLALIALGKVYGKNIAYSGPLLKEAVREGPALRLTFDHTDKGLVAKGGTLTGFVIAGEDQRFQPASAVIDGDTVLVSNPDVPRPVAVRYGWASIPRGSLANGAGLPAGPFRTDSWPLVTSRDVTEYTSNVEQMAWVLDRYLTWNMLEDAEAVIGHWQGGPVWKACWQVLLAKALRGADQPEEASRVIDEAHKAADAIEDEASKAEVNMILGKVPR